jgi:hypothetical protein
MFRSLKTMLGLAALAASLAVPSFGQTVALSAGRTTVVLAPDFLTALTTLTVRPSVVGQGRLSGALLSFPITQGNINAANARGEIFHTGGLQLQAGTTTVQLLNFTIDTMGNIPVLTGLVVANGAVVGRIPLFALRLPAAFTPPIRPASGIFVELAGVGVELSADAATALNSTFGVSAFRQGFGIGTATVRALLDTDALPAPTAN